MGTSEPAITELLHAWREGDEQVLPQLTQIVYAQLRRMAANRLGGANQTLTPTALVHEAFLRLCDANIDWRDRAHFYALAALHMRNVLVDYARAQHAEKRGGQFVQVTLTDASEPLGESGFDLMLLDQAMQRLERDDARTGKIIELTYFGGLNRDEISHVLDISIPTVDRGLRFGRAWLRRELTVA
jgi:RNA polymerase sigma factor (TIGR02999 family)